MASSISSRTDWQRRSETSLVEQRDQRQPVSAISMDSDISSEYDPPVFNVSQYGSEYKGLSHYIASFCA